MTLWNELRRRRVLRTAGLYIVGAWLAIQVASIFFPAWGIPDTALRYLITAAAVCFPVALVFGWRYDITMTGIVRTRDSAGAEFDPGLGRNDYLILGALVAIGLVVLYDSAGRIHKEIINEPGESIVLANSIAVLPFENLDTQQDTVFFSDGVTEEILHRLSTLRSLHVIGRTSSFAFRNVEDGPARIAELIGVRYLLHGSVRRDKDQVRVTAKLTDQDGYQVWSQSFDRKLEGIFSIQSEIASTVSGQVLNEIVPLADLPAGRTTENMDAYNHYLVGRSYYNSRTPGWQSDAKAAFRRAIALDDGFAPAYAGLATASLVGTFSDENEEARTASTKALQLDPDLPEGLAIYGLYLTDVEEDHEGAVASLRRAIELDPSFVLAYNWLAIALYNLNLEQEARRVQEQGLAIDPMNPPLVVNVAGQYELDGDYEKSHQIISRLMFLPDPPGLALWELMGLENNFGRFDEATLLAIETVRAYAHTEIANPYAALGFMYERLGMTERAEYWMSVFDEQSTNPMDRAFRNLYWNRQRGNYDAIRAILQSMPLPPEPAWPQLSRFQAGALGGTHISIGEYDKGIRIFVAGGEPEFAAFSEAMNTQDAIDFLNGLAVGYFRTDQHTRANRILEDIRNTFEAETATGLSYPPVVGRLAQTYLLLDQHDKAITTLRHAFELGWNDYVWITSDPTWNAIADRPDFQQLLSEMRANVERQRARIEAVHDEEAFRAEIQGILSK